MSDSKAKTSYPGVYTAVKKDGSIYFRSSCTYKNKHISLGSFTTEKEAHAAYKEASKLISDKSLGVSSYNSRKKLSFSKWISIINFRDNGLYIKTPIYMKKSYFIYYLDQYTELKFDVDDLFFYSNHTIMRRQGHLFVADYGMQINIRDRYGIKKHAVPGRDYIFVNGDDMDFRYENIKIINRYAGVSRSIKNGREIFTTKIHVNGDFIVGRYSSEKDAAIAYNKAVDLLKSKGISTEYTINYIDGLSSIEYASIYNRIKISSKLTAL